MVGELFGRGITKAYRIIRCDSFRLDTDPIQHYTYTNGKDTPTASPYNTVGFTQKGKRMEARVENAISDLLERAKVSNNIEAEALRKAEIKERTARAMNRADNEWR